MDAVGTKRFRILNRWIQDGYMCGKVEIFHDDNVEVEKLLAKQTAEQVIAENIWIAIR